MPKVGPKGLTDMEIHNWIIGSTEIKYLWFTVCRYNIFYSLSLILFILNFSKTIENECIFAEVFELTIQIQSLWDAKFLFISYTRRAFTIFTFHIMSKTLKRSDILIKLIKQKTNDPLFIELFFYLKNSLIQKLNKKKNKWKYHNTETVILSTK